MRRTGFTNALLVLVVVTAVCGGVFAGIEGSKHDFSNTAWSKDDKCGACHAPHRAEAPKAAPLWDDDADLSRTFGQETSGSGTLMCLRCHDGTIARDNISEAPADRFVNKQHPALRRTGHGDTGDHPVGIEYPQFDKGYRPTISILAEGLVPLPNGNVECISCHDPHNAANVGHMLVKSNARSALCLTCHKK